MPAKGQRYERRLLDDDCGLAASDGGCQAAAAIVGGETEHAMDEADVVEVEFPALVA